MKKAFFFIASAIAILAGCAREASIETPETGRKHITIQASVNPETRTTVNIADGIGIYAWANDEQIAVFESTADAATPFTVNDPENGYFDGEIEAGNTLIGAVSPKGAVTEMVSADGEVEYTLSFSGLYNQGETNAIMVAGAPEIIESDPDSEPLYKFQFKHAAGLMKVTYANIPVGTAGVKFSTNKPITGTVELESLTGVEVTNNDVDGKSEAVVLFENPVTEANTTSEFFVPVPTGSYTGFTICLIDNAGNAIPGTTKSKSTVFTVERSDIIRIPTVTLTAVDIVEMFSKVTQTSDLTDGDYLIVYEGDATHDAVAFKGSLNNLDAVNSGIGVSITNNAIEATKDLKENVFTISLNAGTIKSKSGLYIGASKYENGLKYSAENAFQNSISVENGNAIIAMSFEGGDVTLRYNYASDQLRFRYYKSGQQPIALYKLGEGIIASKLPAEISFAAGSPFTVDPADAESFTAPQLNNPNGLSISWSIEGDVEIAEFDNNDGALLLTGDPGTITVTATSAETSVFAAGSASYTVTVTAGSLSGIKALKAAIDENNGAEYEYNLSLTNAIVSWAKDGKAYLEDNTAGIFVYAGAANLQAGHKLTGETTVKAKTYNGQREITAVTGTALSEIMSAETTDIPVSNLAISDVNNDEEAQVYENMRVVIKNATIVVSNNKKYLSDGTNQVQLYTLSGSGASLDNFSAGDVILSASGYPLYYSKNDTHFPELIIVSTDDIVVKNPPCLTAEPASLEFAKTGGSQNITISAEYFESTPTFSVVANTNPDVFSTSVSGSVITVTALPNSGEAQSGVITIKGVSGDDEATVTVNLSQASGVSNSYKYVFNSKSWGATIDDEDEDWVSGKDGGQFNTTNNGIQVTTNSSGANGTSPCSFTEIEEIVVTYCTNASNGAGVIKVTVGDGTAKSFTVNSTGGTTHRTCSFSYPQKESGKVKIEVTCTTNSIYICDVTINAKEKVIPTKYAISLASVVNGTIAADKETAEEGETVTLTASANSGYEFDSWTVTNVSTNATIAVTDNKFTMPAANVNVTATFKVSSSNSVVYDFTGNDWTVSNGTLSNGEVSFTGEGPDNFKMNSGYFMLGKSGAYINFPTYTKPVARIVVTGRSGASSSVKQNIFVGDTAVSTETTGATGSNTYNIASAYQTAGNVYTLKVTSAHNTQITKIEVVFQ